MNREEREARKAEAGKGPGRPYRKGITLLELARMFPDEASAREWFEKQIWPDGERCCVRLRIVQHLSSEAPHDAVSVPGLRLALQREDGNSWRVREGRPPWSERKTAKRIRSRPARSQRWTGKCYWTSWTVSPTRTRRCTRTGPAPTGAATTTSPCPTAMASTFRGDVHTNGVESLWAILKRAYMGTHHWMSPKHLQRYVNELCGRHNIRDHGHNRPDERGRGRDGRKRLLYRKLVDGPPANVPLT